MGAFILPSKRLALLESTLSLLDAIRQRATSTGISAGIPQPVRSKEHNLAEQRSFVRVRLHDQDREISCDYFETYGSDGHSLAYFQRRQNLPSFVHGLIALLDGETAVAESARARQKPLSRLEWRLTVNEYRNFPAAPTPTPAQHPQSIAAAVVPFPWHTDIESNGDVTVIIALQHAASLQFMGHPSTRAVHPNLALPTEATPHSVLIHEGGALISAGVSRWKCLHRVVATEPNPEHRSRITLVLASGCR